MTEESWIGIVPLRAELIESYWKCLDTVARERKFLMFEEAPSLDESRAYIKNIHQARFPAWAAIIPGPTVIGWCDISPSRFESQAHIGTLGIAVRSDYRGIGIGRILLERALKQARTRRIERVELAVFSSNITAIELYRTLNFEEEGVKRRARKLDGVYEDIIMMARHF